MESSRWHYELDRKSGWMGRPMAWLVTASALGSCGCGGVELTGTVTDADTSAPLANVRVTMWDKSCDTSYYPYPHQDCEDHSIGSTVSDAQGHYQLSADEEERYRLGAKLAGYDDYYTSVDLDEGVDHDVELIPSTPGAVQDFEVVSSGNEAHLSWTNPTGHTFGGVLVLRGDGGADVGDPPPEDGTRYILGDALGSALVVYVDTGTSFIDRDLAVGNYAYVAFAHSPALRYSHETPTEYAHILTEP